MNEQDDELARRLKDEAEATAPAFSELLHQRIMQKVKAAPGGAEVARHGAWRRVGAIAAIVIVGIVLWRLWPAQKTPTKQIVGTSVTIPGPPAFGKMIAVQTAPLARDLDDAQFGYLDQDAQRLGRFVMYELDFIPQGRPAGSSMPAARG